MTLDAARAGDLNADDLRATSGTLALQSEVARAAGRSQLADNLARAAELVGVPDTELLEIYTALRPGRSTAAELEAAARPARGARRGADRGVRPRGRGGLRRARAAPCLTEPSPRLARRFAARAATDLRRELLVEPWAELGLVALDGPNDPAPELVVEGGVVTRLDGRAAAEFDLLDRFLVAHGLDLEIAAEAMALPDEQLARMLVDIDVPAQELVRLARGLTPAKLARVVTLLDPVELMLALKKLRARRDPGTRRT